MTLSPLVHALAGDRDTLLYRPELRNLTGSVTATILFSQMLYWAKKSKWEAFYKFRAPCEHELYRKGDSWTEELNITGKEFDGALVRIATKISKNKKDAFFAEGTEFKHALAYWTDINRVTWYQFNQPLLMQLAEQHYVHLTIRNSQKGNYEREQRGNTVIHKRGNSNYTETTAETTEQRFPLSEGTAASAAVDPRSSLALVPEDEDPFPYEQIEDEDLN